MADLASHDPTPKYLVPALERGLEILEQCARDAGTVKSPELARAMNLPRSTVFRLLNTLAAKGFVERADGNGYRLGPTVARLGQCATVHTGGPQNPGDHRHE